MVLSRSNDASVRTAQAAVLVTILAMNWTFPLQVLASSDLQSLLLLDANRARAGGYSQVSTRRPGTLLNSRTLCVTSRTFRLSACAAISRSIEPID